MSDGGDYIEIAGITRRKIIFVVLCKNGNPHSALNPRLDYSEAKKVADWLDGPQNGQPECGPHSAAAYGTMA